MREIDLWSPEVPELRVILSKFPMDLVFEYANLTLNAYLPQHIVTSSDVKSDILCNRYIGFTVCRNQPMIDYNRLLTVNM
jgi:hypothetical protein